MQSWMALLVAGMLIIPGSGARPASASTAIPTAAVATVVDQAYDEWYSGLGIRQSCSSGVEIIFEALPSRRGEYRTATEQVVIDPGDSLDGMGGIVVHELSHHTFLACGAFADTDFAEAFYAAQGLASDRDWFDYALGWAQTPAEHFAEAMAVTISGTGEGGISITAGAVEVMSQWLAGVPIVTPVVESHEPVPYADNGVPTTLVDVGGHSDDPTSEPGPSLPEISNNAVTIDIFGEIIDLVGHSYRVSVFWLNSWRVIGPV